MSSSRFFRLAKSVGAFGGIGGLTYVSAVAHQKRYDEFQKEHPNVVIKEEFQYVPIVGGYWKLSVDEKATTEKNSRPTCNR